MTGKKHAAATGAPSPAAVYYAPAKSVGAVLPARRAERFRMIDTSQGASSHVERPPRKARWGAYRSPEVLARAGALVREAREKQRLGLREAALALGVSHAYLGQVERGEHTISVGFAPRLALVLDVDIAVLCCAFRLVPEAAAERFFDVDRMRAALAGGV